MLCMHIKELVDSLCRDAILKQKLYNFTTNALKAYLRVQASSLSAYVISKTHIVLQKPCGRQLNMKVCGSKSFVFVFIASNLPWSKKAVHSTALTAVRCIGCQSCMHAHM